MKKKVLLISPITPEYVGIETYGAPALGVYRIAAHLQKRGHQVTIYDSNLNKQPIEAIFKTAQTFDIIGISIFNPSLIQSIIFINRLRKFFPESVIVAGGMEASLNYQVILDYSGANAVCLAEGERVLDQICDEIPLGMVPGLVIKTKAPPITNEDLWHYWSKMDFSKLHYEDYWKLTENLFEEPIYQNIRTVRIVTSSHCNLNCSFCGVSRWRELATGYKCPVARLNPEQIEILLRRIKMQVPLTQSVYFIDDDLLIPRRRGYDLMPVMAKFDFSYLIQTLIQKLTEDMIKGFAEVGVRHITCGIESVSPRVRKCLNKPQDTRQIKEVIEWCEKYNVHCYYLVMLFPPQITLPELRLTYKILSKWIERGVGISVEPYIKPYYGSDLWDDVYSRHYEFYQVNGRQLRWPTMFLPEEREARELMLKFKTRWPEYQREKSKEEGEKHFFKGNTGRWAISLLGELLYERKN